MKYSIESLENDRAKVTLFLEGKRYVQIWSKYNDEYYGVESFDILSQLEADGINTDNTDNSDFIGSIDIAAFMSCSRQ